MDRDVVYGRIVPVLLACLVAVLCCVVFWEEAPPHREQEILAILIVLEPENTEPLPHIIDAEVTAYCPEACCCGDSADGKTATGSDAWIMNGVAADPRALPYGTRLHIPGIGERVVDDTGGDMRRAWRERGEILLDIRFPDHEAARQWGRKKLSVEIVP